MRACALETDLALLKDGDQTIVGSNGVKLSGGQKQRLSIARAVYARKTLAILDDVLSALDPMTEEIVFRRVFGQDGLLRKTGTNVILATHSVKRLPQADLVIALDSTGHVVEKGTFQELNTEGTYVHSLKVQQNRATDESEDTEADPPTKETTGVAVKVAPMAAATNEKRQKGDWSVYQYYGRSLGYLNFAIFLFFFAVMDTAMGLSSRHLPGSSENFAKLTDDNRDEVVAKTKDEVFDILQKSIRPEFLNRIDEVIMFTPLGRNEIGNIVRMQFNRVQQQLAGLHLADRLMVKLIQIDRLGPRIEGMLYKCTFDESWGLLHDVRSPRFVRETWLTPCYRALGNCTKLEKLCSMPRPSKSCLA